MDSSQEWQYVIFYKAPFWFKNATLSSELQQDCTPNSKTRAPTVTTNFHASMLQDRQQLWLMPSHSLTGHLLYAKPSAGFWYGQRGIGCDSCVQRTPPQKVRWTRKPPHQRWKKSRNNRVFQTDLSRKTTHVTGSASIIYSSPMILVAMGQF